VQEGVLPLDRGEKERIVTDWGKGERGKGVARLIEEGEKNNHPRTSEGKKRGGTD